MHARSLAALTLLALLFGLTACTDQAAPSPYTAPRLSVSIAPVTQTSPVQTEAAPTATIDPTGWQTVELSDAKLSLSVPPDWQELEDGGYWSDISGARINLSVQALPPGISVMDFFLPVEYELVQSTSMATGLGLGDCLQINITRQNEQSNTTRYEWHILVNRGDHPAVDFYATASSPDALERLRPQLERLAALASWLP